MMKFVITMSTTTTIIGNVDYSNVQKKDISINEGGGSSIFALVKSEGF